MQPRAGVPGQHHVAGHDDLLGDPGPAGQAEPAGQLALVAARGGPGEVGVLRVLADHAAPGAHVLQRPPHHPGVGHAAAVVGEDPHPGPRARHQAELGELLAAEAAGDGADGLHVDQAGGAAEVETRSAASAVSVTGLVLAMASTAV